MSDGRPVVVYGASGFSARLVFEFLREYGVPFVAAGRNRGKIDEVLSHVPGKGAYLQTGLIQALAAHHLVRQPPRKVGFASPGEAFGHQQLLAALEAYGFVQVEVG